MAILNITLTVNTGTKKCTQSGVPAIRETVNFVVAGLSGTTASNLRLFMVRDGVLLATCNSFTVGSGGYVAETSLNTTQLVDVFADRSTYAERDVRIAVQDIVQDICFLNDSITLMNHPYQPGMDEPTDVDPIAGVDYAPLDGYNAHVNDSDIHITSGERSDWDGAVSDLAAHEADADIHFTSAERLKLTGVEENATADQTASEIRDALQTLTLTNRLNADSVKDGSTNLFFTSSERSKLAGVEDGATADMTSSEIRDSLQTLSGSNRLDADKVKEGASNLFMTSAERSKLTGVETGATADQTAAEIRDALQTLTTTSRLDADSVKEGATNLFLTSAERSKLSSVDLSQLAVLPSAPAQALLSNDSTTYITLGAVATYRGFIITYTLDNTSNYIMGSMGVFHDDTTPAVVPFAYGAYPADLTGVTWDADIDSGNVRLAVTLASAGGDLRFVYSINKLPIYA